MARPAARSHASVTTSGIGPRLAHGSSVIRPDACGSQHFRIPAALRPEWQAGTVRKGRYTQPGGGHGRHGRSRARHAGCGCGGVFGAASPGLPAPQPGSSPHRAPGASPRPPPETLARESRTGGRSLAPAITYSFTYTCRHRYPPDPANAQAVPGINLRVNSQTIYTRKARKTIVVGAAGK